MNRRIWAFVAIFALVISWSKAIGQPAVATHPQTAPSIQVYFSPNGGCTDAIVREIGSAKESVLVQAYTFTSGPIAKALLEAHKRGVTVQVIMDKSQRTEKYSSQ